MPITIQTDATCSWSIMDLPNWVTISGSPSGSGPATVTLLVAADSGASRIASISVAGWAVQVSQSSSCNYAISPGAQAFSASGGTGTISVTTGTECTWSVGNQTSWISPLIASAATGRGAATFQVAANTGAARTGTLSVGGKTFNVEQASGVATGMNLVGALAHLASGGGWESSVTLVNIGAATAEARLSLYADAGDELALPFTFPQKSADGELLASTLDRSLAPNSLLMLDSQQADEDTAETGSAQLLSSGHMDGFAIFKYTATGQQAVVPLETRNASSYLLAFDNTGALATGFAIANLSTQTSDVPVVIRNDAGGQIGTDSVPLLADGHASFMLSGNYPATAGIRGTIEFDTPAGGQISMLGLRVNNGKALTTLPVMAQVGAGGGSMAHVAVNGGWQTTFSIVNTGKTATQVTLNFFDENGSTLAVPVLLPQTGTTSTTQSIVQQLEAGATFLVVTQGQDNLAAVTGSAQLTTTGNVSGFAIFRYNPTAQEAVVPLETRSASAYVLAFDNTNGLGTGLAIANLTSQAASIPVTVRDDAGAVLTNNNIALTPFGHASFMLTDPKQGYPITFNLRGTIEFAAPSGGRISVLGIRAAPGGIITTIPVLAK